jgi:hypothetical protein
MKIPAGGRGFQLADNGSSMDRGVDLFTFEFGYFVLELKLASLEFVQFEIVRSGERLFLLDFPLQRLVAAFEFGEMGLHGHAQLLSMF